MQGAMAPLLWILGFVALAHGEPLFLKTETNITVTAGETAVLPCIIDNLEDYKVAWMDQWNTLLTYGLERIIDDLRMEVGSSRNNEWNLVLRRARLPDRGEYSCQINTQPVKIHKVYLNVLAPARILDRMSSGNASVKEGDTVQLTCNVTGKPAPQVTWSRYDVTTRHERRAPLCAGTEQTGTYGEHLRVPNITRECSGLYQCVAYNGIAGKTNRRMLVDVMFPPKVRMRNTRIGQVRGRETILECEISAHPQVLSVWKHGGETIQNDVKHRVEVFQEGHNTITLSLRVRNIQEEDYGVYTCLASNMLGQDVEEMTLYDIDGQASSEAQPTDAPAEKKRKWKKRKKNKGRRKKQKDAPPQRDEMTRIHQGRQPESGGHFGNNAHTSSGGRSRLEVVLSSGSRGVLGVCSLVSALVFVHLLYLGPW